MQFHVIESSFLGDVAVVDREFTDPFGKFSPSTIEYAQTAQRALSFQISYTGSNIPSFVQIDSDLLRGGLKNGYLYRVVTVAYTKVSCPSKHPIKIIIIMEFDAEKRCYCSIYTKPSI